MRNEGVMLVARTLKTLPNLEELEIDLGGTSTTSDCLPELRAVLTIHGNAKIDDS